MPLISWTWFVAVACRNGLGFSRKLISTEAFLSILEAHEPETFPDTQTSTVLSAVLLKPLKDFIEDSLIAVSEAATASESPPSLSESDEPSLPEEQPPTPPVVSSPPHLCAAQSDPSAVFLSNALPHFLLATPDNFALSLSLSAFLLAPYPFA